MEFSLKYHLNVSLVITRLQILSFWYLRESAIGFPILMVQVRQLWVPVWQERGCEDSWLFQPELQGTAGSSSAWMCWISVGCGTGTAWPELCQSWLRERAPSWISFAGEVTQCARVWWGGAAGREENASTRVIKPFITFNSLAVYIGLGTAAVGRNALAKGKSKYDLTKLEGESRIWTEMALVYTFFFSPPPKKLLLLSGMPLQRASFKQ